jgi:hypothetical protein
MLSFQSKNVGEWKRRHAAIEAELAKLKSGISRTVKMEPEQAAFRDSTQETSANRESSLCTIERLIKKHSPRL